MIGHGRQRKPAQPVADILDGQLRSLGFKSRLVGQDIIEALNVEDLAVVIQAVIRPVCIVGRSRLVKAVEQVAVARLGIDIREKFLQIRHHILKTRRKRAPFVGIVEIGIDHTVEVVRIIGRVA